MTDGGNVPDRTRRQRLQTPGLVFGFWTLLALSYTVSSVFSMLSESEPASWLRPLAWNFTNFYLWMVLAPLVGWLGRRSAGRGWPRFWAVHVPASVLVSLVQTLVMLSIFWVLRGPGQHTQIATLGDYVHMEFAYKIRLALVTYWVILAVMRGMESRRRLRDERLRNAQLETQLAQSQLQALRM